MSTKIGLNLLGKVKLVLKQVFNITR